MAVLVRLLRGRCRHRSAVPDQGLGHGAAPGRGQRAGRDRPDRGRPVLASPTRSRPGATRPGGARAVDTGPIRTRLVDGRRIGTRPAGTGLVDDTGVHDTGAIRIRLENGCPGVDETGLDDTGPGRTWGGRALAGQGRHGAGRRTWQRVSIAGGQPGGRRVRLPGRVGVRDLGEFTDIGRRRRRRREQRPRAGLQRRDRAQGAADEMVEEAAHVVASCR